MRGHNLGGLSSMKCFGTKFCVWLLFFSIFRQAYRAALPLALGASALAGALVTSAIMGRHEARMDATLLATVRNETVVYRQARPPKPNADQDFSELPYTEQIEGADRLEDNDVQLNFPRSVQIIRFVNPEAAGSGKLTATVRESIREGLIKVGGFVVCRPKEDAGIADEKGSTVPREQAGSIMDQVDDFLWEVYQRVPVKKDGTGDFTWKDPAAAKHMGLSLRDYVIGGMDPEFREQLYHAGRARYAAALQWSMLSPFRDDYRQGLASGYKAGLSNSLHGGSRRTGGYGHARAIDITGPEGRESEVWKWIDDHGAKYGLHRPLPKADPAHVQQLGDWHKIALALRERRIGTTVTDKPVAAAMAAKTKVRKTAEASARPVAAAMATKAKLRKTAVAAAR